MRLHSAAAVILVNHSWLMMVAQIEENSFENKDKTDKTPLLSKVI
jgi:hypothetical protein